MSESNRRDDLRSDGGGGNHHWHPPPPPPPYRHAQPVPSYAYYAAAAARPQRPHPPPPPQHHPPTDAYYGGGYGGYYSQPRLQHHHVHPLSHAHYPPLPRQQPPAPVPMMQLQMSPSRSPRRRNTTETQYQHRHVPPHEHYPPLPRQQPPAPEPTMQMQMSPSRSPRRRNTTETQHQHRHVPPHEYYPPLPRQQPPAPVPTMQMSPIRSPSRRNATGTQLATPVRPSGGRPVSTPGTSGRSSRRRTDNNTDSNNEFVFTRNRAPHIHLTRQQQPPQPHGCQNHTRLDTTARPAQPSASTTKLTADQVKDELDKDAYTLLQRYGTNKEFILHGVAVIETSPEVGYKSSLNPDEMEGAYGPDGLITSHIVKSQILRDRSENRPIKAKRSMQVLHISWEIIRSVYCNVAHGTDAACQVQGVLIRFQHGPSDTRGMLYYAKCNPLNGSLIDHSSHHLFPFEIAKLARQSRPNPTKNKATDVSLSRQQEEKIVKEFKRRNPTAEQVYNFIQGWKFKPDNELRTSPAQDNDVQRLVTKCMEFIQNSKQRCKSAKGSNHRYFSEEKTSTDLSSSELLKVVEILSTPAGSPERMRTYNASDDDSFPYLASSNFKICCQRVLIIDHDCDGKTWTYFLAEYIHSSELGERSKQMHPDGRVQGEMDFFLGVCPGDQWQVGHFGISDRKHKYFILCFIIAKSENHEAAGKLVDRACELAPIDKVLVDGGKALSKAIGIKDQSKINELKESLPKEAHPIVDRELGAKDGLNCDSLEHEVDAMELKPEAQSLLCPAVPQFESADVTSPLQDTAAEKLNPETQSESAPSEIPSVLENHSEDMLFEDIVDLVDITSGSLEDRVKVLLSKHRLLLDRCHAHITRNAGHRGGGWRGGKGSLCRALLNSGCNQNKMKIILGHVFMMSKIPWNDVKSFRNACVRLLLEFDKHIKKYVRKAYLNGNPSDLGSHCSHRPGENMSTNGAESRGKEVQKGQASALSGEADTKEEAKNPIHMLAGFGIDANKHMSLEDPLKDFAVNAPRENFINSALEELRKVCSYSPPKTVTSSTRRVQNYSNLTSTFLYSIVTIDGVEQPHELVLGNKQVLSFTIHFPTSSRVLTSLSLLMQEDIALYSQAPAGMKSRFVLEETKNVQKLISHLETLRPKETQALYEMLAEKRRANTPELQAHENLTMYLQRRAHRNIDPKWADPTPPSKKGVKGKKGAKGKEGKGDSDSLKVIQDFEQLAQEKLARDKDAGEVEVISSARDVEPKKGGFNAEQLPIDGDGGILESALSEGMKSDTSGHHECEKLRDRIRLKRQLGDWVETNFCLGNDEERMKITCNCEDYSVWGFCEHCIYIEVLHRGEFNFVSKGTEQWQENRKKALHNIKTQCERVRSNDI